MMMSRHERLRATLAGEPTDRVPVWFMRQAGRYMAEYRALREKVSFLELCASPELCAKVTCQPIDAFDLDAAIIFSDILVVPEAMGQGLTFGKGHGPRLAPPVRTRADIDALRTPSISRDLGVAPKAIRMFRELRPDVPIFGFAGAPWTLLCYMVEGSGSKDWAHAKALLWSDPEAARALLNRLADIVGDLLQAQVDAGAAAVQLFDTWAGALAPEELRAFALPAAARALARVKGAPRLYFSKDTAAALPWLHETGADAFGVDWRTDLAHARRVLGATPVQGNLDPIALHAPPAVVAEKVRAILEKGGGRGHIFNLGHGVVPSTPIEGVRAMIDAVKQWKPPA